jgi:hypothetical protein
MDWERRPESDTPHAEQRELRDEQGRTWVGSVTSGERAGGEAHAQVIFVCRDQPSELKRVSTLEVPARDADAYWSELEMGEVEALFRRAEPH